MNTVTMSLSASALSVLLLTFSNQFSMNKNNISDYNITNASKEKPVEDVPIDSVSISAPDNCNEVNFHHAERYISEDIIEESSNKWSNLERLRKKSIFF